MTKAQELDFLIKELKAEEKEYQDIKIPDNYEQKESFFVYL